MSEAFEFDVVVVGHGIAGLCAAVSAMERGKKVAVLERAPEDDSGGCTRYTEAYLRLKSEDELSDDFEEILAQCGVSSASPNIVQAMAQAPEQWSGVVRSSAVTDPDFIATFARETIPTIQWLKDKGIRFIATHLPHITLRDHTPMIVPSGGGLAMQEALLASAVKGGVSFFYETAARGLMQDAQGKITGVEAVSRNNRPMQFHAGSVVLACGGFEGNPEMLARYMGQGATNIRPVAPGCHFNLGDGIEMAKAAGAALSGDYNTYHATPIDERSGRPEAKMLVFPYGIVVNRQGYRFIDEAPGASYETFDRFCHAVQAQEDGVGYAVYDAKMGDIPNYERAIFSDKPPITAGTLEGLARELGIPEQNFLETVEQYNAACQPGDFHAEYPDGLRTHGLTPRKSNWARPIDTGPFHAYPLISSSIITLGGIKTDASARVLNTEGDPIPNLYAAGAVVGMFYRKYAAATSVLRGAVFGRIAGAQV
ncbi:FAD-dependent oxidoreductase [Paracandidimonas soli]|uniref:Tricarballylate dehydrogenase n=1 Tax=Paracandidimonas soli TaxID=1917182 RepID=A0A4R3UY47_9BURK|nr:FAD-dependent oxidoreductase [Paracandidimonas soli]TCU96112.1 tricarballylate dehydrogenase [Paracandidimonas soli]